MKKEKIKQQGFTLIELLIVIVIIGVLASISVTTIAFYRQNAAYAVVEQLGADVQLNLEVSSTNEDDSLPSFAIETPQSAPGALQNASARQVLKAVQIPNQVTFQGRFDPDCRNAGCESAFIELRHLKSRKYLQLLRAGDGIWSPIEQTL